MSWTSRLGDLSRFSPFTRSPPQGSTKVSDADFSYITADDLKRHDVEPRAESPVDYGPKRETDELYLKHKKKVYHVHFPAYSIAKGELTVGQLRDKVAQKAGTSDVRRVKLLYKGKNLKYDERTCKSEGLKHNSEIMISIAELSSESGSESDDGEEDELADGLGIREADGETASKKRNRGKKTKKRNKREAAAASGSGTSTPDASTLGVPPSQSSTRPVSPRPAAPITAVEKLNALHDTLRGFLPDCEQFMRDPPKDPAKKDFEHKKLSETIMSQVLLKTDGVETEGDPDARARRKALVNETQKVLQDLDAMMKR